MRRTKPLATIFAFTGAFVGFLVRPSDMYGRQLPLSAVITRGATLHGLNRLVLQSVADRSFDVMLLWLALGGILGAGLGAILDARRAPSMTQQRTAATAGRTERRGPRPE